MRKTPSVDVVGALGATDGLSPARCRGIVFRCSPPGVRDSNHLAFAENLFCTKQPTGSGSGDRYTPPRPRSRRRRLRVALIAMAGGSARELASKSLQRRCLPDAWF